MAPPAPASAVRHAQSVGDNARFTFASPCVSGELQVTPNPITVTAGGYQVVHIGACNAATGDRMGAYITRPTMFCDATKDYTLATGGDFGSSASGTDFSVVAGSASCKGDTVEITDLTTGAIASVPITVVY